MADRIYVTVDEIKAAAERIRPYVVRTPLLRCEELDAVLGCEVYLKPEMLQNSGSFKIRGAANRALLLTDEERARGIICISAGNHAKACACIGKQLGIKTVMVMPDDAPKCKIDGVRAFGGEIWFGPRKGNRRVEMVDEGIAKYGYVNIDPSDDLDLIAGAGTVGLEIIEDLPDVDKVFVPCGGAGLLSGVATAVKNLSDKAEVVGVQAAVNDGYTRSFNAKDVVVKPTTDSVADGLNCSRPGTVTFPIVLKYVDAFAGAREEDIITGTRLVAESAKLVAEPSSCVGIAAVMNGDYKCKPTDKVVFVLTAGNWDIDQLGRIYKGEYTV